MEVTTILVPLLYIDRSCLVFVVLTACSNVVSVLRVNGLAFLACDHLPQATRF